MNYWTLYKNFKNERSTSSGNSRPHKGEGYRYLVCCLTFRSLRLYSYAIWACPGGSGPPQKKFKPQREYGSNFFGGGLDPSGYAHVTLHMA